MHRKIEETPEREKMLIRLKELRLERGYSMDCLITLAKLYDCSLDYLAGVSDQPRKYGR